MQLVLVMTPDVPPIPGGIRLVYDWGQIGVRSGKYTEWGNHILVEGDEGVLRRWLLNLNFWRGIGQPQEQRFEVSKFKEIRYATA